MVKKLKKSIDGALRNFNLNITEIVTIFEKV